MLSVHIEGGCMLGVLFLAAAAASGQPSVTISPAPNGFVAKVETFDGRYQSQIDAEIDRRAAELCAGKTVRWGEFRSDVTIGKQPGAEPPQVSGFSRAFSCVSPVDRNYAPAPADWKPSAADEGHVRQIFQTYYAHRDAGDFRAAKAMFAPGILADDSRWSEQMAEFNAKLGTGRRRVSGVTWYVNPESAPHPGVYVALDFIGDFPRAHFYCGYLVLFRTAEGAYELTREEQNHFDRNDEPVDPVQLAQMRASMCRGQ